MLFLTSFYCVFHHIFALVNCLVQNLQKSHYITRKSRRYNSYIPQFPTRYEEQKKSSQVHSIFTSFHRVSYHIFALVNCLLENLQVYYMTSQVTWKLRTFSRVSLGTIYKQWQAKDVKFKLFLRHFIVFLTIHLH